MSTVAASGLFHSLDGSDSSSKPASPASPTNSFQTQQSVPRAFTASARGQVSAFPSTPSSSSFHATLEPPPDVTWSDYIQTWQDDHVARWLAECKCGGHADIFKANDIRGDILLELDHPTLQEMGLTSVGDRFRILSAVKQLRHKVASKVPPTTRSSNRNDEHTTAASSMEKADAHATGRRRLESGRPAPLLLNNNSRNDLPRLIREQGPDSAKLTPANQLSRPLPQPVQGASSSNSTNHNSSSSHSSSSVSRSNLPPLPPPPRGQPPLPPPGRPPIRNFSGSGKRTPTQSDNVPAYVNQALPPAPSQGLLTPSSASSNWTGYHLPADPRPGNPGGGKTPQSNSRATSPLPRAQRGTPTGHGRTNSAGLASPVTSSPNTKVQRSGPHPYATGQSVIPNSKIDLSPIAERFNETNPSSPPLSYSVGRGPFNPGTPSHSTAPSLDDLRRKLVKIALPDEGLTYTIDVDNCAGGVEVLEKVLKKFGKGSVKTADSEADNVHTEDGGLSVDGWGAYLEDGTGPLDEAALLSYCHASLDHPARDRPLQLRKISKARREGTGTPLYSGPRPQTGQSSASKAYKRASSISVLSGLGVPDPEKALEPPSPTQSTHESHDSGSNPSSPTTGKRPSKLRNFFGQRPPSELITTHLTEYFPFTEKKVLERTARQSMLRVNTMSSTRRDSTASWKPPLPSRFSASSSGSGPRNSRTSISSTAPPPPDKPASPSSDIRDTQSIIDDIPRVSLSTDDGRSIHLNDGPSSPISPHPELLPPIPFPSESLSESLEGLTGHVRRMSRTMSNASRTSRRMSYMTELRSKRDRSDTASLMTVDEITAEVENRRNTGVVDKGSDTDEWTEVDSAEGQDGHTEKPATLSVDLGQDEDDEEEEEEDDESEIEDEITLNDDTEEPIVVTHKVGKWIKGALIGAGSFGKVYLGMDASSGLLMAVKQVELPTGSAPNEERKQSMLAALEHEIELLQDLQHDNIVQYLYSSLEEDCLNIFLEYVPGGSVTALLSNYGAFEEPLVKNFVRQILQGLCYLHDRDIIHRDIKGANILVDNKGGVKISDFGISKKTNVQLLTGNRVHRPSLQGSVFWMAPEVVKQTGHTQKADIWSVGCLVVEMLTGEHPWAQLTQMQAIFKIGSSARPEIPSDISSDAQDFLSRTFDLDHEARPRAVDLLQHPFIAIPKKA